tara:strand:- start:1920 stop:2597 length:678 start_codon:yes stop_codon:yes gene_type:complete
MKPILIIGDHHGEYNTLFNLLDKGEVKDCILIHVGDCGVGFKNPKKQKKDFFYLNNRFKKRGIEFLSIRGNHDDPSYFDGSVKFSNFKLIADYSFFEINGIKFGFVGGAISIDRKTRTEGENFFSGEEFVLKPELTQKCQVLITHSGTPWNPCLFPNGDRLADFTGEDPTLREECLQERIQIAKLIELIKPQKHFCGHFHFFSLAENNGCVSRILGIMEIVELTQ